MTARPLDGIRILDLTTVVVGPVCTVRLAEYGAEILKIEPREGDLMRMLGGPSPSGAHAGSYLHLNRGKRSIGLDIKSQAAAPVLARLLQSCDVLVSNMRLDALARLRLDAASLRAAYPRLVHCTITGFGSDGPYAGMPAYDSVIQGVSGVAGLFERRDGAPRYAPLLLCDHVVGEIAAGSILAALVARGRTGLGSAIEIPMHETMAAFVLQEHLGPATFDPPLGPPGDRRILNPDNRPFQTRDGWISLTANTDAQCRDLLRAIGRDDLLDDPRFRTVADRFTNVADWFSLRAAALRQRDTADWLATFRRHDVPAMPCHTLESLLDDPHLNAVGLLAPDRHPTEGAIRALRPTPLFDDAPLATGAAAATLGQDTRDVLSELGFSTGEIDALFAAGAATGPRRAG